MWPWRYRHVNARETPSIEVNVPTEDVHLVPRPVNNSSPGVHLRVPLATEGLPSVGSDRRIGRHVGGGEMRKATVLALGAVLLFVGCSNKSNDSSGTKITATIDGSGSTFQKAFDEAVIDAFRSVQSGITVTYAGGGSGQGKTDLAGSVKQWAGTDSLVKPEEVAKYTHGLLYWPIVAAPITLSYRLTGVTDLTLDAPTVAKIFQRQIKTWNDPAIKALNPSATLPTTKITPVVRDGASGTNTNFTKWLAAASGGAFTLTVGDTTNWPKDVAKGSGNPGVAAFIDKSKPVSIEGAIGYVDYSDAKASSLSLAKIVNKEGKAVAPTLESTAAALEQTALNADLTYNPLNAEGDATYPIATPTWIITQKTYADANVVAALKAFLSYIYSDGQGLAADIDYAKLPSSYVDKAKAQLSQLTTA
jgi:phosphate transport system substrate-binding protein